jgi:hypothetical protein
LALCVVPGLGGPFQVFGRGRRVCEDGSGHRLHVIIEAEVLQDFRGRRTVAAGLITGSLELSKDGKAMKYYEVTDFDLHLTASVLAEAATTLTSSDPQKTRWLRQPPM